MSACGSQVILCDLPIRFDTYRGCSHNCKYCFVRKKVTSFMHAVEPARKTNSLRRFISGKRTRDTNWCDWNIPIHWGGLSDPFQPAETEYRESMSALKVFADTYYPFVFSTKGAAVAEKEYLSILSKTNSVGQVSVVSRLCEHMEQGAPSFDDRIRIVEKLAKVCRRVIARIQPLFLWTSDDVIENTLPLLAKAGCYGVTVEGFKAPGKLLAESGMIWYGNDYVYKASDLYPVMVRIRDACHYHGMKFYSAENRLRKMGDDLCCCGVDGLDGFTVNTCNLNHIFFGEAESTAAQDSPGTGAVFHALCQRSGADKMIGPLPFSVLMEAMSRVIPLRHLMGFGLNMDEQAQGDE